MSMFSLFDEITGKLLLSLHHGKHLKEKYPHACVAENEHFLEPCPKYFLSPDTVITAIGHGVGLRSNFPRLRVAQLN